MIIVKRIDNVDNDTVSVQVYADTLSELGTSIPGVPKDKAIQPGSLAYDSNGNVAIYNSSNTWVTVQ
jgi:hypothetical protein